MPETPLLSPEQAAERLGVSRATVYRRIADGTIPAIRLGQGPSPLLRIDPAALGRLGDTMPAPLARARDQHRAAMNRLSDLDRRLRNADNLTNEELDRLNAEVDDAVADAERASTTMGSLEQLERARENTNVQRTPGDGSDTRLGEWLLTQTRSLLTSTGSGQYVVPDLFWGAVWDRLAATSVGLASGFTVINVDDSQGNVVRIPRLTADAASGWVSEGAAITPTDPTLNELTATPQKLAILTQISNEAIRDSNPKIADLVMTNIMRSIALKLDLGFFEGSGSAPEIRGLKNVAGIGTVSMGTNGASPTNLDPFADAIGTLAQANAEATAIVMHPRTWQSLSKLKEQTTGNNKPLLQESAGPATAGIRRTLYGVPVYLTSQLAITETQGTSTDCSSAYVYQANEVLAVRREQTIVEADSSRLFNQDMTEIRGIARWDLVVPNPTAVVRILGIRP